MCFFKKKKRQREAALKQEQEAKLAAVKAEEAKKAAELKKADAEKKAAELKKAEDEKKAIEQAAELAALEEAKIAAAKAEELKKAEDEKRVAQLKKTEDEKKAAQLKKTEDEKISAEKPIKKATAKTASDAIPTKTEAKLASEKDTKLVAATTDDVKTIKGKVEIFLDKEDRFRFRLKAANGITIARSESYSTKAACKKGFSSIQNYENIDIVDITDENTAYVPKIGAPVFEIYKDNGGEFRFRYRSGNAIAVLFCTGGYTTKASCINSVKSVIKNSCNFEIVDITKEKKVEDDN